MLHHSETKCTSSLTHIVFSALFASYAVDNVSAPTCEIASDSKCLVTCGADDRLRVTHHRARSTSIVCTSGVVWWEFFESEKWLRYSCCSVVIFHQGSWQRGSDQKLVCGFPYSVAHEWWIRESGSYDRFASQDVHVVGNDVAYFLWMVAMYHDRSRHLCFRFVHQEGSSIHEIDVSDVLVYKVVWIPTQLECLFEHGNGVLKSCGIARISKESGSFP